MQLCSSCGEPGAFSRKRNEYFCANCEAWFHSDVLATTAEIGNSTVRVFLSYGHDLACEELVRRLESDLKVHGYDVWIDKKRIEFGDDWRREITDGLRTTSHVLAFLSKHSTRKPGVCRQELAIALGPLSGHVYTVLVEPLSEVTPPLVISHLQWLDMQHWQSLKVTNPDAYEELYRESLVKIINVIEQNIPFSGEIEELRHWLQPLDCTSDMIAAEGKFTGRHWLLSGIGEGRSAFEDDAVVESAGEIECWRTSGSEQSIFWLAAEPGWGKSAVAARLAHAGRARVLAVHFCRHDMPERRDARQTVLNIAFQIASQLGEYRTLLVDQARHNMTLNDKNARELFNLLLANPLSHTIEGGRSSNDRHLIVLDALDETLDDNGYSELISLVASEFGKLPRWIGLLVTSRPEAPVMRQLGSFGVKLQIAADPRNLKDVQSYIEDWLTTLSLSLEKRDLALKAVITASASNFLYVRKLQEAVLCGAVDAEELMHPTMLPQGLSSLYERWFQNRFPCLKEYSRLQRPLLELLIAARESLPIGLAGKILAWDDYDLGMTIEPLGTLCSVHEGRIKFFHKSLRDWLANIEASGRNFYCSEDKGHKRMAEWQWSAYIAWKQAGASLFQGAGWETLGRHGETYTLSYLPSHLKACGRVEDRLQILMDFAFAMRRSAKGMLLAMLADYRSEEHSSNSAMQAWAHCILSQSHVLRRGTLEWPAHKILLQLAIEHANDSAITVAAEHWLQIGQCDWTWLRRKQRDLRFVTSHCHMTFEGHSKSTIAVLLLPERRMASISEDCSLRIWNLNSGNCENIFATTDSPYSAIIEWPQGKILAWSRAQLHVFNILDNHLEAILEGHAEDILGVSILSDGSLLSYSEDGNMLIWCATDFSRKGLLEGHVGNVQTPLFDSSGQLISWAKRSRIKGPDSTVRIWNLTQNKCISVLEHENQVFGVCVVGSSQLLTWIRDSKIFKWEIGQQGGMQVYDIHRARVCGIQILSNGSIISWDEDNTLLHWELEHPEAFTALTGHENKIEGVLELAGGRLLTWSMDNTLRIWEICSGKCIFVLLGHSHWIVEAGRLDDEYVFSRSADKSLRIWSLLDGTCHKLIEGNREWGGKATSMNIRTLDNSHLVCWTPSGNIARLFDVKNNFKEFQLIGHTGPILGFLSSENHELISWSDDCSLRLWSFDVSSQMLSANYSNTIIQAWNLGPALTAASYSDHSIRAWNKGELVCFPIGHDEVIKKIAQLAHGRIMSISLDKTIRIWDLSKAKCIAVFRGHTANIVNALELCNGMIVSWSVDCTLRVWEIETGQCIHVLFGHQRTIINVMALEPSGLISWSPDGTFRIWDETTGVSIAIIDAERDFSGSPGGVIQLSNGKLLLYASSGCMIFDQSNKSSDFIISGYTHNVIALDDCHYFLVGPNVLLQASEAGHKLIQTFSVTDSLWRPTILAVSKHEFVSIHTEVYRPYLNIIYFWNYNSCEFIRKLDFGTHNIRNVCVIHSQDGEQKILIHFRDDSLEVFNCMTGEREQYIESNWIEVMPINATAIANKDFLGCTSQGNWLFLELESRISGVELNKQLQLRWHAFDRWPLLLSANNEEIVVMDGLNVYELQAYKGAIPLKFGE